MKKIIFFFIFFILAGAIRPFYVSALDLSGTKEEVDAINKEINARKDKIKELESTIDKYKKNIVEKQTQAQSLKNQLSILDNHIAQIQTDIELTQEKIKETKLEIDALNLSIADKQKSMARQKNIVATMVRNLHAGDQKNYLEIALTYDNFSEFYDEVKNTESVYVDLGRSVKALRLAKEELDAKKAQVEAKKTMYENLKIDLDNQKSSLTDEVGVKQNLLVETKGKELQYQTLLSSLKQQYNVIEGEVKTFEDRMRKKLEEEDKIGKTSTGPMAWPVPNHHVNATFHDPDYPYRNVFEHSGMDIRASQGTPVRAASAGYVAKARRCTLASCYAYVLIVHSGSLSTVYGHLSSIVANDNDHVNQGDIIGYSGGTPHTVGAGPFVTGPHLHFEVRLNGIPVNPATYLGD